MVLVRLQYAGCRIALLGNVADVPRSIPARVLGHGTGAKQSWALAFPPSEHRVGAGAVGRIGHAMPKLPGPCQLGIWAMPPFAMAENWAKVPPGPPIPFIFSKVFITLTKKNEG